MTSSQFSLTGRVIDERYRVEKLLAQGGMASVYSAVDERLDRTVALKVMHVELSQDPRRDQFVERFQREAKSAASIDNPHIVQVYDTGTVDGLNYLVMEYVHGINIRQAMSANGAYSVRETLRIVAEILDGLAAAHTAGVIHRDIKPENIMISDRGRIKITDFGLARAVSQATLSTTHMMMGTAGYMAPELIENNDATAQGDIYSLGIMAWEMLTNDTPFKSDNPMTIAFKHVHEDVPVLNLRYPGMPEAVTKIIQRFTARSLDVRPKNGAEALRVLKELAATLSVNELNFIVEPQEGLNVGKNQPLTMPATASTMPHETIIGSASATAVDAAPAPSQTQQVPAPPTQSADTVDSSQTRAFDATQAINDTQDSDATQALAQNTTQNTERTTKPKRKTKVWIAIITILLLAASGSGIWAWWYYLGPGSYWSLPQPDGVNCQEQTQCAVSDVSWKEYQQLLNVAGIPFEVNKSYSDTIASGNVIATDPQYVGAHISKRNGQKVTVTVSQGVQEITIPEDILDPNSQNGKDPITTLEKLGFDNIVHNADSDDYSLTVPTGAAISITPEPGSTIKHSDAVTVVLSKGLRPVAMPSIEGMSKEEAQAALDEIHINAQFSEEFSDTVEAGKVISASQEPNAELHWNDTVNVVISKGPETATIPSGLIGKQEKQVSDQLTALGFKVETNRILGGIFGTVRDISADGKSLSDGGSLRLRDSEGNPTVITLTVV